MATRKTRREDWKLSGGFGEPEPGIERATPAGCHGGSPRRCEMTHALTQYGLPILFAVVLAESFGIPLPGETALIAFGVLAARGHYSIVLVVAVAASGAIVGDNLGYWLI